MRLFSHSEYGVNVDFLSCRTVLIICRAIKENQELYLMTSASLCSSNETLRGRRVLMYTTQVNSAFRAR